MATLSTARFTRRAVTWNALAAGWATIILCASWTVHALPFAAASLEYEETYDGETGFPTSPEVDAISAGGLVGSGGNPGAVPTISAGEATTVLVPPPTTDPSLFGGVGFAASSMGAGDKGLRSVFNDVVVSPGLCRGSPRPALHHGSLGEPRHGSLPGLLGAVGPAPGARPSGSGRAVPVPGRRGALSLRLPVA